MEDSFNSQGCENMRGLVFGTSTETLKMSNVRFVNLCRCFEHHVLMKKNYAISNYCDSSFSFNLNRIFQTQIRRK